MMENSHILGCPQLTRCCTGQVSDGRGSACQIFHVRFKLLLAAAMVVIIRSASAVCRQRIHSSKCRGSRKSTFKDTEKSEPEVGISLAHCFYIIKFLWVAESTIY